MLCDVGSDVRQSGSEYVFLKTAADRSQYRAIMLGTTGLLLVASRPIQSPFHSPPRSPSATALCRLPQARTRSSSQRPVLDMPRTTVNVSR